MHGYAAFPESRKVNVFLSVNLSWYRHISIVIDVGSWREVPLPIRSAVEIGLAVTRVSRQNLLMSTKALLTADDLARMPEPEDEPVRMELDEGELITTPPAGEEHGFCEINIGTVLGNHVKKYKLGRVYNAGTGFRLNDITVRAPDVAFVRKERLATIRQGVFANGAPDLAVEVFSPLDSVRQLMRKVKQYFAAGCHTVWIVYPERREVNVLEASGADRLLREGDTIDAPELLPGFSVAVAEFFAD
jgi:Uma2 family endonuclease